MNEAILKKVQAIYGAPSLESVNPMNEPENTEEIVLDETPALEAYSEEELELLHQEIVEDYTAAMETITPELANLEYTIMLESVGLSLDRFNEFEGVVSMEAVKKAVKDGKVTKDSAFKSIIKRIVNLFWATIDNITGNTVKVLKYGKLLKKYSEKLDKLDLEKLTTESDINIPASVADYKPLEKFVTENNKIYAEVAKFSGMITPKDVVGKVYSLFSSVGINVKTEDFSKQFETLLNEYNTSKGEEATTTASISEAVKAATTASISEAVKAARTASISEAVKAARTQSKEHIRVINGLKFGNIREKLGNAKKKMIAALENQKAAENDATKKEAIQADLNRLMKLFAAYKTYNKKATTQINKSLAVLTKHIGKVIDAYNKATKSVATEKKEETK